MNSSSSTESVLFFRSFNDEKPSTIILLHGGLSCGLEYAEVVPLLCDYHILVPDLPEHSKSRDIPFISLDNVASHVAQLVRFHAHESCAHVVGLSMGGFIAQRLALHHPSLVLSLWITGAAPFQGIQLSLAHYPRLIFAISWLLTNLPDPLYWRYATWIGFRRHEELLIQMRMNCRLSMLRDEFASIAKHDLDALGRIRARMLVVAGGRQDDLTATAAAGKVLRDRVGGGSRAVVVKDALHAWDLQFPELFAQGVLAWIEQRPLPAEYEEI